MNRETFEEMMREALGVHTEEKRDTRPRVPVPTQHIRAFYSLYDAHKASDGPVSRETLAFWRFVFEMFPDLRGHALGVDLTYTTHPAVIDDGPAAPPTAGTKGVKKVFVIPTCQEYAFFERHQEPGHLGKYNFWRFLLDLFDDPVLTDASNPLSPNTIAVGTYNGDIIVTVYDRGEDRPTVPDTAGELLGEDP